MALGGQKFVYVDPFLSMGGTEVTDTISKLTLLITHEVSATRRAGHVGPDREVSPIYDWQIDVDFQFDSAYAAGELNQVIWALMRPPLGTATGITPIVCRPLSAVKAATNPEFVGSIAIDSWSPFGDGGQMGEYAMVSRTFMGSGNLVFTVA